MQIWKAVLEVDFMVTRYEISFKHEILNEFIASINGFIGRNYNGRTMPEDISAMKNEVWSIYNKLPLEDNMEVLNSFENRLVEIRDYVRKNTPTAH